MTELVVNLWTIYHGLLVNLAEYYSTDFKIYLIHGVISAYLFYMWLEYVPSVLGKNDAFTLADLFSSLGAFCTSPVDNNHEGLYFFFLVYCVAWLPILILVKICFIIFTLFYLIGALKNINKNKTFLFLDKIILFKRKRR